jgi:hypothetical protein
LQTQEQQSPQQQQLPPPHVILQDLPSSGLFMQELPSPGPQQQYVLVPQQQQQQQPPSGDQAVLMQHGFQIPHQQQMLLIEQLMPGHVGLQQTVGFQSTPSSLDMAFSPNSLPGLPTGPVTAMSLGDSNPHGSSRDMWMMPGAAALVLQQAEAGAADKQGVQSLQGMLAVQQHMQGIAARGSGPTAADARQLFVQHSSSEQQLGGSAGSGGPAGALGAGGPVVLLTSADPAVQYLQPQGHPGHQ